MRREITKRFNKIIAPLLASIHHVAIVGGSSFEPELEILKTKEGIGLHFFGIESDAAMSSFEYLDLNTAKLTVEKQFDLILCSQVLEHLWDVKQAIENLVKLTKPGGLIWIACPASNFAHGSPDYFSAGYQPDLIVNLLNQHNVEILTKGTLGSRRYYFFTHALQTWPTSHQYRFPLLTGISRYYPIQIFERLAATIRSSKISDDAKFATETFVLARVLN